MSTFDFILPAKNAGSAAEMGTPMFQPSSAKASEPFDKMMNRALAKPSQEPREKLDKPSVTKKPAGNPSNVRKSKPFVEADSNSADSAPAVSVGSQKKCEQNSPSDESDSETKKTDDSKVASDNFNTVSADSDNASALQALAASLVADQPTIPAPAILKAATSTDDTPIAAVGAESAAAPKIINQTSENLNALNKSDAKPAPKESAGTGKKMPVVADDSAKNSDQGEGTIAIQALVDKVEAVNETPVNKANPAPIAGHGQTPELAGTSAAQQAPTMKNADPAKVAGTPEQSLPGVTVVASASQAASRSKPAAKASARVESSEVSASVSSAAENRTPSTAETSPGNLISASSQTELRARALDRTHDILALHGLQLKQTNTDSLHVVIKPGAGLQLSLQMKQTSDGIEAQAILQQGDFHDLNKHWTELQQRLEERGIKLAPLGNESAATNSGNQNFQHQSRQPGQQDALSAGAFAEFASVSASASPARTIHAPAVAGRGWESWA